MNKTDAAYQQRIAVLHRELGIPTDYAVRSGLSLHREADELVAIVQQADGTTIRLTPSATDAWDRLRTAALADGVSLIPLSGFRSVARQAEIIRRKFHAGQPLITILAVNAAPGFSEHHTGCALDIGTYGEPPLTESFALTPAFSWLKAHASRYGFHLSYPKDNPHGIVYEPWHWRWKL